MCLFPKARASSSPQASGSLVPKDWGTHLVPAVPCFHCFPDSPFPPFPPPFFPASLGPHAHPPAPVPRLCEGCITAVVPRGRPCSC